MYIDIDIDMFDKAFRGHTSDDLNDASVVALG